MNRQFSAYETFAQDDLFSLGFLCLEKFEKREILQEFYNVDEKTFDWKNFNQKKDFLKKRNLEKKMKNFLDFLINFVLVERNKRIDIKEAHKKIQ